MDISVNLINNEFIHSTLTYDGSTQPKYTITYDGARIPERRRSEGVRVYSGDGSPSPEDKPSLVIPRTPFAKLKVVPPCSGVLTNVLLIDCTVPSYKTFVDSVNADTLPIVYSTDLSSETLIELLRSKCTTIPRLGLCFVSPNNNAPTQFLNNTPLFNSEDPGENVNSNLHFVLNLINDFSIKNIDFLGCNTLNYSNWKNYYDLLTQTTGVIVGASNDKTGNLKHGGDWIMESTSQDIELVYFTESIENYSYLLDNTDWITSSSNPKIVNPLAMVSDGTYIYGSYANESGSIFRIHIASKTVEPYWVVNNELKTTIWQMVIYNGELYGTLGTGTVFRINTTTPSNATYSLFTKEPYTIFRGIAAYNNKLYITCYDPANIYVFNLQTSRIDTKTFIGGTITNYFNSLQISPTASNIGLGQLFIYDNYLYGATNELSASISRVFKWSVLYPTTDNSMNFMAQGTDPQISNSILPDRVGGWVVANNQLYFVRNDNKNVISRLNLTNLTDYTYGFYTLPTNATVTSGLTSNNEQLYFQDNTPKLYQINLIRPTTPISTVSIDIGNTYSVGVGNLKVSITDPSNGLNDVYYQYSITGVNSDAYTTANTFKTGPSSFSFYINNIYSLTDISYTINVIARNPLGRSSAASQSVVLYTLPTQLSNCSVVYANGNINVSITESSPVPYYYLNNVSYLYYLYTTGTNQYTNISAYTVGANVTSSSYNTNFAIPNIPVTTNKYRIYLIARNQFGNTISTAFSTNVYSIPYATVSFDTGNTKTVAGGNLQVQLIDLSNISINDVYYYYSINNTSDTSFANTFVKANVSPYTFLIPSITDISNTIYVRASNPVGNSSPTANLQVIVYQQPRQPPSFKIELVDRGNVQVTITENTSIPFYYLNNVSYYLYAYNNVGGTNLSGNTSLLVYNRPVGILSNTNSNYDNVVSYVTGLTTNPYTMYLIATNPFGTSVPVYANINVYTNYPVAPTIDAGNTVSSTSGNLTVSITDNVNRLDNGVYYWYSTDNITYGNSGVAKTSAVNYRFTINNTGNKDVPLVAGTYTLYIRAINPLQYASAEPFTVKVYTTPQVPTILTENTYITNSKRLTVSIIDSVNSPTNDIYYYYSTDNIAYGNSGVIKTADTTYQFVITDTGNSQVPLNASPYLLYIRAQNSIGNVTTESYNVLLRNIPSSRWLEYANYSNKFNQTYFRNFIDINGECIVRNGSMTVENDGTFTGNIYSNKNLQLVGSGYIQTDLTVDKNVVINSNISVKETANLNRLKTTGDASFNANVFVTNTATLNKLFVTGDSSFNGNMIILKNTTLNSDLTVNRDTTIAGKIYGASDATFGGKVIVSQDTTLQSGLSVFGQTNIYGYRTFPVLNFLRSVNVQADYNFAERSFNEDPPPIVNSSIINPFVLNTFTNTTDASFNRNVNVYISSGGITYYYTDGLTRNKGGLFTNPVSSRDITNVTIHMLIQFESSNTPITWKFLEILTKNDASYSSLYAFNLSSNGINVSGANNQFTISDNSSISSTLSNTTFKSGSDMWISVSQNIINGDSTIYLNGISLCSFKSVVAYSPVQSYIAYSVGYSYSVPTNVIEDNGVKTIKRIILDYNGKYTNTDLPQIIGVFNTYNTLYVPPVINVNSDTVTVKGNVDIQNRLDVTGNTAIKQQLGVIGDVSFGSNLYVAKNTNMNNQLGVIGDVSFGSKLYVANTATLNQKLDVFGDASFNKNIHANTISITGDVSFVSPTGTLYANSIKLKRSAGMTGTITSIDANTISAGIINVDSLNATNGIITNKIISTGEISATTFNVTGTGTDGGRLTAKSITAPGGISVNSSDPINGTISAYNLYATQGITAVGTIQGGAIISDSTLSSTRSITAGKDMIAGTFATTLAVVPLVGAEGGVYVEKIVRAGSFAIKGQPEFAGQINGEKLNASETITAGKTITAASFKNTNNSFEVTTDGNLTAASLTINGTITIAGGTELATINATNTISAGGEITAASFKTSGTTVAADNGGISVTTVKATGAVTGDSFTITGKTAVAGQVTIDSVNASSTITASGAVTGASFKTTSATASPDNGGISVTTVKATGAVTGDSFTTTGKTAVAGQVTIDSVNASSTITASGAVTGASFKTTSATVAADNGGISVTTVKATGAVTGDSFTTTGKTAVAGQVTVTTVNATGVVTAASFNATSDIRLKQNINDMPSQWENIKALKPSEYNWTENSKYDCGFIAQQIYTVYPHLRPKLENVIIPDNNKDDCPVSLDGKPIFYTIDYGKMTPYLCKGLQEVMSETEKMKQEIAELKAQIQRLLQK